MTAPVFYRGRTVGWLDTRERVRSGVPILDLNTLPVRPAHWLAPAPDLNVVVTVVRLRVRSRDATGVPTVLVADDLAGLLRVPGFSPEDWALAELKAAADP